MASGPPSIEPPGPPPTAAFVVGHNGHGEPSFRFTCDDYDGDGHNEPDPPHAKDSQCLLAAPPRSSPASFLHPDYSPSLRPPTPEYAAPMASGNVQANGGASSPVKNPFNFQTQFISTVPVKSNIGQRRGHRYKHSSISAQHQIFQEPPPRPPPVLPASLPIPTLKEAWASMQRDQRARLWWCCCHAAVAMYVFFSAEGSLALTALSHLVFFDVGSAAVCVVVDVLGNFEVWRRSTIRHPFGLQRAEVLAGFAMSVFLVFGGFDLISHNLKHMLEGVGGHTPHHSSATNHPHDAGSGGGHSHSTRHIEPGAVDLASLAAVVSTLVNAYGLRNNGRIRRVMRVPFPYLASILPGAGVLANPFHFLTLCFAFLMLLLPLVSVPHFVWLDRLICAAIAASMFVLGTRLAVAQGLMLLMSYSGVPQYRKNTTTISSSSSSSSKSALLSEKKDACSHSYDSTISSVLREIESEPAIARVEEAQFWQVHYGLAMANLRVRLARNDATAAAGNGTSSGTDGDNSYTNTNNNSNSSSSSNAVSQLRSRLARIVQNRLGEGYGRGGNLRWEVTVESCGADG
ncbi:hypothetical protein VTK26DRAFT_8659 [Humicola hyalothermophila]